MSQEYEAILRAAFAQYPGRSKHVTDADIQRWASYHRFWLQDPMAYRYKPGIKSSNINRVNFIHDFTRYLFRKYEVPLFIERALTDVASERGWTLYLALTHGEPCRDRVFRLYGFTLSRTEAHQFIQPKGDGSVLDNVMRVLMMNHRFSNKQRALRNAIKRHFLFRPPVLRNQAIEASSEEEAVFRARSEYASEVLRYMGKHAARIPENEAYALCDYLLNRRNAQEGLCVFELKSIREVLSDMRTWHRRLWGHGRVNQRHRLDSDGEFISNRVYKKSNLHRYLVLKPPKRREYEPAQTLASSDADSMAIAGDLVVLLESERLLFTDAFTGDIPKTLKQSKIGHQIEIVMIEQILSRFDLIDEGDAMSHCIASRDYYLIQATQELSVWSMRSLVGETTTLDGLFRVDTREFKRMLTIEVRDGDIVEARGKYNRCVTDEEERFLKDWAEQNGLGILDYALERDDDDY